MLSTLPRLVLVSLVLIQLFVACEGVPQVSRPPRDIDRKMQQLAADLVQAFQSLMPATTANVAVADFAFKDSDYIPIGANYLRDELARYLASSPVFTVLATQELDAFLDRAALEMRDLYDHEKVTRLGRLEGAEYLVLGSIYRFDSHTFKVLAKIFEMSSGKLLTLRDVTIDARAFEGLQVFNELHPQRLRLPAAVSGFTDGPYCTIKYDMALLPPDKSKFVDVVFRIGDRGHCNPLNEMSEDAVNRIIEQNVSLLRSWVEGLQNEEGATSTGILTEMRHYYLCQCPVTCLCQGGDLHACRCGMANCDPQQAEDWLRATTTQMSRNIVLLLDTSGSMDLAVASPGHAMKKIDHARDAAEYVARHLSRDDVLSVVSFADQARVLLGPRTPRPGMVSDVLDGVEANGGTNLYQGLQEAWRLVTEKPADINRIMLLTDGLPTEGETRNSEFKRLVKEIIDSGASISVFAAGQAKGTELLHAIAYSDTRNMGALYNIDNMETLARTMLDDLLETLVVRDVRVDVNVSNGVVIEEVGSGLKKQGSQHAAGTLGHVTLLKMLGGAFRVRVPQLPVGHHQIGTLSVRYRNGSGPQKRVLALEIDVVRESGEALPVGRREVQVAYLVSVTRRRVGELLQESSGTERVLRIESFIRDLERLMTDH